MSDDSTCDQEIKLPDPSNSLLFFFIVTAIYGYMNYQGSKIDTEKPIDFKNLNSNSPNIINILIYILVLVIGNYFINITISSEICGQPQWGSIFLITLLPWTLIFVSLVILLLMFPGWLAPFSNTIGYLICNLFGLRDLMLSILRPQNEILTNYTTEGGEDTKNASLALVTENLNQIYSDKSILINEITEENFEDFWERFRKGGLLNIEKINEQESTTGIILKNELFNFIVMKNTISKIIWFSLTGLLISSIVYNYIANNACSRSLDDLEATHDAYIKLQQKIQDSKENTHLYNISS